MKLSLKPKDKKLNFSEIIQSFYMNTQATLKRFSEFEKY